MFDDSIDQGILLEFVDESLDSIENLPELFIKLEHAPHDSELVNAIFRPVHSIKGNAAFFGMLKLKKLTHELETTLDKCRKGELTADKKIINTLLKGLDEVSDIFSRVRNSENEVTNEEDFNSLLEEIVASQASSSDELPSEISEVFKLLEQVYNSELLTETTEKDLVEKALNLLKSEGTDENQLENADASTFDLIVQILSTEIDDALPEEKVEEFDTLLLSYKTELQSDEQTSQFEAIYDEFKTFAMTVGFDSLLAELLKEKITALNETIVVIPKETEPEEEQIAIPLDDSEAESIEPVEPPKTKVELADPEEAKKEVAGKTMRVPENTIDEFLNFVGELVVVREMYDHLRLHYEENGVARELTSELHRHTENFRQISGELERTCMNIRKQPIKQILRKMPRIVRDVGMANGKEIEVEIIGEQIQVDKSLIGIIEDPLVHMIRNAADHGVEPAEERLAAGKDEKGLIKLIVTEDEENLYVSIKDDGKGLNYDALLAKGRKMGVFTEDQTPSQQEISKVIFMSGVSTAEKVTDISGRGVGMDVVKRYIESAGGSVTISSETGKGSEFKITLRKSITTQIINGLVFRLNKSCYVIPLKHVVENFPPESKNFCNVYGKHEYIKRHDQLLKVIRLSELFSNKTDNNRKKDEGILIVIDYEGKRVALLADEVVNIQQIVLKPLKGLHMNKDYFCGGALRGDGYISLVLDIEYLMNNNLIIEEIPNPDQNILEA
ncbi:MAG: chemotaxis protein CheA [Lentisphaeraceae bacterium]|nr:chemotaxis protein CheA [Lentisphaeraceae bacterium]